MAKEEYIIKLVSKFVGMYKTSGFLNKLSREGLTCNAIETKISTSHLGDK